MNKFILTAIALSFFGTQTVTAQAKNIAEKLGYPKDSKLLIIHADDLGVSHSENRASIKAMEEGCVNSASIMVPCPWFPEIADYAKKHPEMDFGLHLTITSEWKHYKWGPSYWSHTMASFRNEMGYFYDNVADVASKGNPDVLFSELATQIRLALESGIDVTHLDTHMGALLATPEFLKAYIKAGKEFQLPILLTRPSSDATEIDTSVFEELDDNDVFVDSILTALPNDFEDGMEDFYTETLNALKPGLNCLLIHAAYDDEEMQAITVDHPDWGAEWRQADFNFFTSEKCRQLLRVNDIQLVTWREIRNKITRAD